MANTTSCGIEHLQKQVNGISVVLPCKNEEKAVAMTIKSVAETLDSLNNIDYEIIVVDDGSTDGTRAEALKAGARVLVHNINMGYGNSIMDGVKIAKYDLIAILDADGTYPISQLPELFEKAKSHDMVIGTRTWNGDNTSLVRSILRKSLYYVILYLTNIRAPDYNSGFRLFHKHNILGYRSILCPTFSFTTSLTLLFLLSARSVCFVPINYAPRIGDSKVSYLSNSIKTFSYIFIIANIFQAYRLSLIVILLCLLINFAIIFTSLIFSLGMATQIGLHITVLACALIGVIAMNTAPVAKMYLDKLRQGKN